MGFDQLFVISRLATPIPYYKICYYDQIFSTIENINCSARATKSFHLQNLFRFRTRNFQVFISFTYSVSSVGYCTINLLHNFFYTICRRVDHKNTCRLKKNTTARSLKYCSPVRYSTFCVGTFLSRPINCRYAGARSAKQHSRDDLQCTHTNHNVFLLREFLKVNTFTLFSRATAPNIVVTLTL